jgi:hypothetical protein
MRRSYGALVLLGLALAGAAGPRLAVADALQTQSFAAWRVMQECAKQSNKQFPDHTPDGNAKREAARQECVRAHRLPVSDPAPAPAAKPN